MRESTGAAPPRPVPPPSAVSDPVLAVLGAGEMEAEARLQGFSSVDVIGPTWPPAGDGMPDTMIELKLSAPGLVLESMEVRSAPDPTVLIWSTRPSAEVRPLGVAHGGQRLLNDPRTGVAGLEIEDFVVLRLFLQDGGFLQGIEHPGTITLIFRGGDVATIPVAPSR